MTKTTQEPPALPPALLRGTPFHRLLRRFQVERGDQKDIKREAAIFAAVAWVPLLALGLLPAAAGRGVDPILWDLAVHARLLVAVPSFFFAESILERSVALVSMRLSGDDLADRATLADTMRRPARFSSSTGTDVALAVAAIFLGQAVRAGLFHRSGFVGGEAISRAAQSAAFIWYATVSFPLFVFLGGRVLLRWMVWIVVVFRISRLALRMVVTHPDLCGGLSFLTRPTNAFSVFTFGMTAAAAGAWGGRIMFGQARVADFVGQFAAWCGVAVLLAEGPLCFFAGQLLRAQRAGRIEYGRLALIYSQRFHERWAQPPEPGPGFLGSDDIEPLNAMGGIFERVDRMRPIPITLRELAALVLALLLPVLPLVLTELPVSALLRQVVRAMVGTVR